MYQVQTFFFRKKSINVSMSFFCNGNTRCGPLYVRSGPDIPSSANSSDSSENFDSKASEIQIHSICEIVNVNGVAHTTYQT